MDRNQKLFIVYNESSLAFIDVCGVNASFHVAELNISEILFLAEDKGDSMRRLGTTKILLLVTIVFLILSLVLSVLSLFPIVTEKNEKISLFNDSFRLSQNEVYRKGIGTFQGGENISVIVESSTSVLEKLLHRN